MPTLPYLTDTSTQLSGTYTASTAALDNFISSNYANTLSSNNSNYTRNASNILKANIDTKQDILTAATNLLGVGTAITNIAYANITGKPTYFNTDWGTTVVNKPTYFNADWGSTIANRPTLFNADWGTTVLNKPSTFPADMTNIYNKTEVNTLSTNNSNYTTNASNALQTNINTTNSNITSNYLPKTGGTISGLLTTANIDCGGGIAINGANAFYWGADIVDAGNKTNTYINFKDAGASSDWCYLRQIGNANNYKLAFDFHDDGTDARFCIRNVKSTDITDTITEVFLVDNGNITCTGKINLNGELVNGNWKMTNDSDFCRLYNNAGTSYFNFAAKELYASTSLTVLTNASIGGTCTAATFSGSGASLTNIPFTALTGTIPYVLKAGDTMTGTLTISGICSATTFSGSGASLSNIPFTALTGTSPYVLKAGDTMSGTLTMTTGCLNITGNVSNPGNSSSASFWNQSGVGPTISGASIAFQTTGTTERMRIDSVGNVGIGINNPQTLFHIKGTDPILTIMAQGSGGAKSQLNLTTYNNPGYTASCSLIATDNGSGGNSFQINLKNSGNINNTQFTPFYISDVGNIGIGITTNTTYKLYVNGTTYFNDNSTINGSLNATTINRDGVEIDTRYLKLSGGTMTGNLTTPNINIYDTTQLNARLILSGQEFYQPGYTSTDGIAFLIGVNRTDNKQLWIADSSKLTQNTTNPTIRLMPNNNSGNIDAIATNGLTKLPLNLSGSVINLKDNTTIAGSLSATTINRDGIEIDTRYLKLSGGTITGDLNLAINNKLRIDGGTSTTALSIGGYGLIQVDAPGVIGGRFSIDNDGTVISKGYIYAGGTTSGLRINGNDYGNTLYQNASTISGQPANIGFTLRDANTFNFYSLSTGGGVYTNIMNANTTAITLNSPVNISSTLNFGNRAENFLINLWATNEYGFGINGGVLRYNTMGNHSFYCNGILKANIDNAGTITATTFSGTTVLASGTSKASKFMIRYGEQTAYNYNWNGTGLSGWFIGLNQFWSANSDNGGTAYLTMTVCGSTNYQYCWFGRVYVKGDGYTWGIVTDFKTPTSGSYELFVTEHFDGAGNNVLRFRTGTPGVLTENLRFKICG